MPASSGNNARGDNREGHQHQPNLKQQQVGPIVHDQGGCAQESAHADAYHFPSEAAYRCFAPRESRQEKCCRCKCIDRAKVESDGPRGHAGANNRDNRDYA